MSAVLSSLPQGQKIPTLKFRLDECVGYEDFGSFARYDWKVTAIDGATGVEKGQSILYTTMTPDEIQVESAENPCVTNAKLSKSKGSNGKSNWLVPSTSTKLAVPDGVGF